MSLHNVEAVSVKPGTSKNGEIVTPMRSLVSVRRLPCDIAFVQEPSSPFLLSESFQTPSSTFVLTRFEALERVKTPFRVSLRGIVHEASRLEQTSNGNEKKTFTLADEAGMFVSCIAIGENARIPTLADLNEIIVFFAHGVGGKASSNGHIMLFSTSTIWSVSKKLNSNETMRSLVRPIEFE